MNPLFEIFDTPFNVPPFEKISHEHFEPALRKGMKVQVKNIQNIIAHPAKATFENTIVAYEASGKFIREVLNIFFNLNLAHTNEHLQQVAKLMNPELSKHGDEILMNVQLFQRIEQVWKQKATLHLDTEKQMLLEKIYQSFKKNGAHLSEPDKTTLKNINRKLASLTLEYGQNVLNETNENQVVVTQYNHLQGIPENLIKAARKFANEQGLENNWIFKPHQATYLNLLTYADNRELREAIWKAYTYRGNRGNHHDNNELIKEISNLRTKKAVLLGYPHFAAYVLEDAMAKNVNEVRQLLERLWTPALNQATWEKEKIVARAKEDNNFLIQPYDWMYYAEQVRKEKFALDEAEILPYFSLDNVRAGVFKVLQKLYGIQFHLLENMPLYHHDVECFQVNDSMGHYLGILYMDCYSRSSKQGGAWMTKFRGQCYQNHKRIPPVIAIVCNFTPPAEDGPSLLSLEEVKTFFHEFGHALHGLFSNVKFESLAGTAVPRDFVELPSQLLENWAFEPAVLKLYARHIKTGEILPQEIITKLQKSRNFNQGFLLTEYLAAALLDMAYHTQTEELEENIESFETQLLESYGILPPILPRYKSTYFNHIFSGGYAASYYSYIWAETLDAEVYQTFSDTDIFNPDLALRFKKEILEKGGSLPAEKLFANFLGRSADISSLLKRKFDHP